MVSTLQVGFYGNYSMIISTVTNVIDQMSAGTVGSIGNIMVTESDDKCAVSLRRLTLMFFFIASASSAALFSCLSPFVSICWGSKYIMDSKIIFVCVLNNLLTIIRMPLWNMLNTSGLFKRIKNVSIAGTLINLVASILLTLKWGMIGIFIGTTLTIVIQIVLNIRLIYGVRLKQKLTKEYLRWSLMTVLGVCAMLLSYRLSLFIHTSNRIVDFILIGLMSSAVGLVIAVVPFCWTNEFKYCCWLAKNALNSLNKKLHHSTAK
jgi:O-antigen/teichoic acid export membrane protein